MSYVKLNEHKEKGGGGMAIGVEYSQGQANKLLHLRKGEKMEEKSGQTTVSKRMKGQKKLKSKGRTNGVGRKERKAGARRRRYKRR